MPTERNNNSAYTFLRIEQMLSADDERLNFEMLAEGAYVELHVRFVSLWLTSGYR
jgi:hypothetical protein